MSMESDYKRFLAVDKRGNHDEIGNMFSNLSRFVDTTSSSDSEYDEEIGNVQARCEKRSIKDLCYTSDCLSFKDLAKRARLSAKITKDNRKTSEDVIIISSDDDEDKELDAAPENLKGFSEKIASFKEKTNEFCSSTEVKKDDNINMNKPTTEWFFSPRKREIQQSSPNMKTKSNVNHQRKKENRKCGAAISLEDSPIGKSFFRRMTLQDASDWQERVGASAPLLSHLEYQKCTTSLKPRNFSTSQTDFLDGLADDPMFYSVYIDMALTFASNSIAPPGHVVMHIFSIIAQCEARTTSLKAVNCLRKLLSMRILTHRNFYITWDILVELASNCLHEIKMDSWPSTQGSPCINMKRSTDKIQSVCRKSNVTDLFLFVVSFLEEDLKRYHNSRRYSIIRRILSPCLHGYSRLRNVGIWLTELLQIFEYAENMDNNNVSSKITDSPSQESDIGYCRAAEADICAGYGTGIEQLETKWHQGNVPHKRHEESPADMAKIFGKRMIRALQRLFHLIFLVTKDAEKEARVIAEAFLNCFFEIKTLRWRKILLSTIEPSLIQQSTSELILSTMFEDAANSAKYKSSGRISLEKIVSGYFYKELPYEASLQARDENIELFLYLLWMFVRSYLTLKNLVACRAMRSLSVLSDHYKESSPNSTWEVMSHSDIQIMLYFKDEVCLLRGRLLRYRGLSHLSDNGELYLNLLRGILQSCKGNITG